MISRRLRTFGRQLVLARDGSLLPIAAIVLAALVTALAFAVDYGALFVARRRMQAAVDLAAIVGAQNPAEAARLVSLSLADNGFASPSLLTVEAGQYRADGTAAPSARFRPNASPANAVRVSATVQTPLYFGRAILKRDTLAIATTALAAQSDYASVSIGSRLAAVNGGLANALLGAMLGTHLGLTVADYNALLGASLDLFAFTDALATTLGITAGSYDDVLSGQATVGQILSAASLAGAGQVGTPAVAALRQISLALPSGQSRLPVSRLASLGDLGLGPLGSHDPTHPIQAGLLDLVTAAAALSNGSSQVTADLSAAAPSLASARITLSFGQPPQASWTSPQAPGVDVATRQGRLLLDAVVAAPLGLGTIDLPIYVDVASAQANLQTVSCPWSVPGQTSATLSVRTGVATVATSNVAPGAISVAGASPSLTGAATLVALPLVNVTGRALVSVAGSNPQTVTFSNDDIAQHRVRTVSSTGLSGSLVGTLVSGLSLDVKVVGLGLSAGAVSAAIGTSLQAATPAIDALLDGVLRTLGIGVGQADVWINGVNCGRASLVQ